MLQQAGEYNPFTDPAKVDQYAAMARAEGVSLPVAQRLLNIFAGQRTPSVSSLGRRSQAAQAKAAAVVEVLDEATRPPVVEATFDEFFAGQQPILMGVEPASFCWITGDVAANREGVTWAAHFDLFANLEHAVTMFELPAAIRRAVYTTNVIESVNSVIRPCRISLNTARATANNIPAATRH